MKPRRLFKWLFPVSIIMNLVFLTVGGYVLNQKGGLSYLRFKLRPAPAPPSSIVHPFTRERHELFDVLGSELVNGGVVLLGDSLTHAGAWGELLGGGFVRNRGISGDTTLDAVARLDDVVALQPDKIFILIGINDLKSRFKQDEILSNYGQILKTLKTGCPLSRIYAQSVLPTHNDIFVVNYRDVELLNEGIRGLAESHGVTYIDLYPAFTIYGNQLNPKFFVDGIHLTPAGYLLWARLLKPYVSIGS